MLLDSVTAAETWSPARALKSYSAALLAGASVPLTASPKATGCAAAASSTR